MVSFVMMQQGERGEIKGAVDSDERGGVSYLYSLERMGTACMSEVVVAMSLQHPISMALRKLRQEVTMSDTVVDWSYGRKSIQCTGSCVCQKQSFLLDHLPECPCY